MKDDEMTDQYRIIGQLEAQMDAAEQRMERIEKSIERIEAVVREIKGYIDQQRGGWKIIVAVAGAGGAIGASIVKLFTLAKGGQ